MSHSVPREISMFVINNVLFQDGTAARYGNASLNQSFGYGHADIHVNSV
jgi:hypothetical protein